MATIFIDKKPYTVRDGQNLLQACLSLGFDLPFFCWHPTMHSVGACRQCAVKVFRDEKDTRGRIVMACMTPAADGTHLSIDDPEARKFRASVIEWLMLNHPHDCPVCDEGGECHLQDMTVMTGHTYRRSRFKKRTYRNQDLGPFVTHEMNRCIQCYRCVRFYRDYAGGSDLNVFASHDHVYFGRYGDGVLESTFAGNLVEVCPTGVFTDKTEAQHYTRKWDLRTAPSVCIHCSLGCNTIPGERTGMLRRIRNRYNREVNGYFLCDRGRFGYEFVNSDLRIREVLRRNGKGERLQPVSPEETMSYLGSVIRGSRGIVGIGSPRASLEANFALRMLVGPDRFFCGASQEESDLSALVLEILSKGPARTPALDDVRTADSVLVLGEDIGNTAPMLALNVLQATRQKPMEVIKGLGIHHWDDGAVRVATQNRQSPLFVATPFRTALDERATGLFRGSPDRLAALAFLTAREIDPAVPCTDTDAGLKRVAEQIAAGLKEGARPAVISGTSCGSGAVIRAAADIAWALSRKGRDAVLAYVLPECNSMGAAMLGGKGLAEAVELSETGDVDTLIILENDLYRRMDRVRLAAFLERFRHVIVLDHIFNATTERADVVLPAAPWAEAAGTLINNEGRAQRFFQVYPPPDPVRESWRWLGELMDAAEVQRTFSDFDSLVAAIAGHKDILRGVVDAAPDSVYRVAGMKIAREHYRASGRTSLYADRAVVEPAPPNDTDSALSFSMEGYQGKDSALTPRFWAPGWNSVQSVLKFQTEVNGPLVGGPAGKRLIEADPGAAVPYYRDDGEAGAHDTGLVLLPLHHVFGSEELSMHAPGIATRASEPYLVVSEDRAQSLGVAEGEMVAVRGEDWELALPVRPVHGIAGDVVGVSPGPGTHRILFSPVVELRRIKK